MNEPHTVDPTLLPTLQELSRATTAAVVVAAILLVTAVLPAEAGIDPTGIGRQLGLTTLGELKHASQATFPAKAVAPPVAAAVSVAGPADAAAQAAYAFRSDELSLTLKPGEGAEIKAVMRAGDQMVYEWTADKGEVFFEFHGEPKGAPADVFASYEKGSTGTAKGEFEAPFEGIHGWYWKNRARSPVTIQLKTSGVYEKIFRK